MQRKRTMAYGNPVGHAVICGSELDFIHHKLTQCHNSSRPMDIIIQIHASVSLWSLLCHDRGPAGPGVMTQTPMGCFQHIPVSHQSPSHPGWDRYSRALVLRGSGGGEGQTPGVGGHITHPSPLKAIRERRFGAARDPTRLQTIR